VRRATVYFVQWDAAMSFPRAFSTRSHPACAAFAAAASLLCLEPSPARACSEPAPVLHHVTFTARGILALAGPQGRVTTLEGTPHVVREDHGYAYSPAAFTHDGRAMLLLDEDYSDEELGQDCLATFVDVVRVELATGARTVLRRLRSGRAQAVRISPDDRLALVMAGDSVGEPVVHLFDLGTGSRVWVTRDVDAFFLDSETLLVEDEMGELRVARATDRRAIARIGAADDGRWAFVPGDSSADQFTLAHEATTDRSRSYDFESQLVRVVVNGRRARLERSSYRFRGHAVEISRDGSRVLVHRGSAVAVLDRASGRGLHRIRSSYRFTAIALAPDGGSLALVTLRRPTRTELEDPYDPHASMPTMLERFDLATAARTQLGDLPASSVLAP
jgi:hypothetical protein